MTLYNYKLSTHKHGIEDITQSVIDAVEKSKALSGICAVYIPHSTAAITTFSPWDERAFIDLREEVRRIIPTRIDFNHQHDTPEDAAGHIKSAIFGTSESFIIDDGKLLLGHSQKIYFLEFDGPRSRQFYVKIIEMEK